MAAAATNPQSLGLALRQGGRPANLRRRIPRRAGQPAAHAQLALSYSFSPCRAWVPPPQAPPRSRAPNAPYPGSRRRRRRKCAARAERQGRKLPRRHGSRQGPNLARIGCALWVCASGRAVMLGLPSETRALLNFHLKKMFKSQLLGYCQQVKTMTSTVKGNCEDINNFKEARIKQTLP